MKDCPCQTRYFLRRVCRATTVVILATIIAIFLSTLTAIEAYLAIRLRLTGYFRRKCRNARHLAPELILFH